MDTQEELNFATVIILYKESDIVGQRLRYKTIKWKNQGSFDALNDISDHVTLSKLMYLIENANNTMSIVVKWIFYSNFNKYLLLSVESLNPITSSSYREKVFTFFDIVLYDVRYNNPKSKIRKGIRSKFRYMEEKLRKKKLYREHEKQVTNNIYC